ncbi:Lytic polysaccharide monooxygenase [Tuber magnatum]|uniref:Lytic polysaccharide monooxygenase n=1 Tax=Tuber magnatum TaxID=42249 RepID=A0A317SMA1_9PEZI|nr:Lytic polysaccharide monooxygenase [Tuber magnatum]
MVEPKQWNVPEVVRASVQKSDGNLNPLQNDGSNFPCHGVAPEAPVATYLPGTSHPLKLRGSAVHGGGSGQMAITYDPNPTKNTVFRVMTSYMGDHPIKAAGNLGPADRDPTGLKSELDLWKLNPLSFTVPKGLPKGKAVVAWTWFNRIGNREMYMKCATVIIGGEETSMSNFEALPGMFKANIGGGCTIPEQTTAIDFKNPGPEVFGKGITPIPCGEPSSQGSGAGGSGAGGAGNSGPGAKTSAADSIPPTKTGSSAPSPSAKDEAGDDGVSTTYVTVQPSPTTLSDAPPQTSLPNAPTTLIASTFRFSPPQKTGTVSADACTTEGEVTCGENRTWYMCGSGRKQLMGSLAQGTTCTAGKIAKRGIRGYYF